MKKIISFLIRRIPRKYLQRVSGLGLWLISLLYAGKAVRCPICQKSYRKFMPYGRNNPRPNALCPNCLSLERHRLIWLYLERQTSFFKKQLDVLHIAPEKCFMPAFEQQHGNRYVTADLESPWAKVKMDIHAMPFEENQFDVVLCNHVLEHVESDIRAMKEIRRVLRPGGWAILQVPFFSPVPDATLEDPRITRPEERMKAYGQDDHVRKFGKDYPRRIEQAGLVATESNFGKQFSEAEAFHYGIVRDEIIFIGGKA